MTPDQFKEIRLKIGMTQRQLAIALNLGKNGYRTIQRYEAGDIQISGPVQKLLRYIAAYGAEI